MKNTVRFMRILVLLLAPSAVSLLPGFSAGEAEPLDLSLLQRETQIRNEVETKVKTQILDPVLGEGKASAFADVELEIVSRKADQSRTGIGVSQRYKEKGEGGQKDTKYILPGIPKPKSIISSTDKPEAAQGQQAQQEKGVQETRYGMELDIKRFQLTVIHDDTLPKAGLETARQRINDALLPYKVRKKDPPSVLFKPTKFKARSVFEDVKRPGVYLPLLYALLSLLLLMFLFGPVASFMRKYVSAMLEKPGAEVNVESKLENQEGGKGGVEEGHQRIDMMFQQKPEEEKKDDEEDEAMKKFEPFSYINEENLKRLVYIFLLRRDEPWVIAVVLSYLKPEFARQALAVLPLELQAKVAIEALTVRQVTREQVTVIDADIKENIDFVVGGVERLTRMIEDSDSGTRQNILDYLKSHKPALYEKVRRCILTFEDIAHFPDKDMQIVVRGLNTEDMAKSLQRAAPEIGNKFFANMSANAANLLKETMEYSGDVTTNQMDAARIRILDVIKTLEKEGKIVVREKGAEEASVDDIEMSSERTRRQQLSGIGAPSEPKEAPGPAELSQPAAGQMQQYLDAGVSLYNEGRYEESIQYLQYAAQGDASLWQAFQYLGGAFYALQRLPEAFDAYEKYAQASNDPAVREWVENLKQQSAK